MGRGAAIQKEGRANSFQLESVSALPVHVHRAARLHWEEEQSETVLSVRKPIGETNPF